METIRNVIVAILVIAVLAIALFVRQGSRNPLCRPALFLGQPGNHPQEIVEKVIAEVGGLPQVDSDLARIGDPRVVVAVDEWEIRSAVVQNREDFAATLRDERAAMSYAIDMDVAWEDGASGIVQWTSWRYGMVSCPVALFRGSGPLGQVRIVRMTPAPPEPTETPAAE